MLFRLENAVILDFDSKSSLSKKWGNHPNFMSKVILIQRVTQGGGTSSKHWTGVET